MMMVMMMVMVMVMMMMMMMMMMIMIMMMMMMMIMSLLLWPTWAEGTLLRGAGARHVHINRVCFHITPPSLTHKHRVLIATCEKVPH